MLRELWFPCIVLFMLCGPGNAAEWQIPPGDKVELAVAAYAKALCSQVFISGRDIEKAKAEDGSAMVGFPGREKLGEVSVDRAAQSVQVKMPNGVVRMAKRFAGQGCVTLPRGADTVSFAPVDVVSALPDPATQDWPMGDRLPATPLPPELDKTKLDEAVNAAFGKPKFTLTAAFAVAYKGRLIAERYEEGTGYSTRFAGWSMGKSVNATLMGQLIQEGVYDLWSPAPVAEWQKPDDLRHAIRIADLLRMSSGLFCISPFDPDYFTRPSQGYADHWYLYSGAIDSYQWAITRPAQTRPNSYGRYRNCDPVSVGYLIRQAVEARGENYLTWPQRHLFDRIGSRGMVLETDPFGNFLLQGYEFGPARDWLRLGMLYLQDGLWNGERLLPEGWTDFVRTPAPAWLRPVYGGAFWLAREPGRFQLPKDAYFMEGNGGQFTFIIPTHDLVVVRLGHDKGEQAGVSALKNAIELLMQAVPKVREEWTPPKTSE